MPKGVEHVTPFLSTTIDRPVTTSVMPKGVEHAANESGSASAFVVTTSVMPKGVEHFEKIVESIRVDRGDYLCDAERR